MHNEVKMIRNFIPVGQGAFYRETFYIESESKETKTVNIVYDCGAELGKSLIEKRIESTFNKNSEIEALFISHFHDDHINGIPKLLEHCKVKNIFIPYMIKEDREFLLACSEIEQNKESVINFFLSGNIVNTINNMTNGNYEPNIYMVYSDEDREKQNQKDEWSKGTLSVSQEFDVRITGDKKNNAIILDESLDNTNDLILEWRYVPANVKHSSIVEDFRTKFKDQFSYDLSVENIREILKNPEKRKSLKNLYASENKDLNMTTMVLLSFSEKMKDSYLLIINGIITKTYPAGCLYLGDFNCNYFDTIHQKFSKYFNCIDIIQIPHHGSKASYNSKIVSSDIPVKYFVISVGNENNYNHPDSFVIDNLVLNKNDSTVFIVTESLDSGVTFLITRTDCRNKDSKYCKDRLNENK